MMVPTTVGGALMDVVTVGSHWDDPDINLLLPNVGQWRLRLCVYAAVGSKTSQEMNHIGRNIATIMHRKRTKKGSRPLA